MARERGTVYLLHFDRPYKHAAHYLGWVACSGSLNARLAQHRAGRGARLLEVVTAAGIGFTLARTWEGSRYRERQLKRQGGAAALCPICRAAGRRRHRPPGPGRGGARQLVLPLQPRPHRTPALMPARR